VNLPATVYNVPKLRPNELCDERLTFRATRRATRYVVKLDVIEEPIRSLVPGVVHGCDPQGEGVVGKSLDLLVTGEPERKANIAHGWALSLFDADDDIGPIVAPVTCSMQ
jgi:hypothetical protein